MIKAPDFLFKEKKNAERFYKFEREAPLWMRKEMSKIIDNNNTHTPPAHLPKQANKK
jgi:hypothetical protein